MKNSTIEWTDHTFNPWIGCSKISSGCLNCYAEEMMDRRYGRAKWGVSGTRSRTSESYWKQPFAWNRAAAKDSTNPTVFCASLSDVFEDRDELIDWRLDLFSNVITKTKNLTWLILTKRIDIAILFLSMARVPFNVWIGHSICTQQEALDVLPKLARIGRRIGGTFLSCEPILEPIELGDLSGIDWVIVGGESGPNARECHVDWIEDIKEQCQRSGTPVFVKQLGSNPVGVKPLRSKKGGDLNEWPKDLRVQEFPHFSLLQSFNESLSVQL